MAALLLECAGDDLAAACGAATVSKLRECLADVEAARVAKVREGMLAVGTVVMNRVGSEVGRRLEPVRKVVEPITQGGAPPAQRRRVDEGKPQEGATGTEPKAGGRPEVAPPPRREDAGVAKAVPEA